MQNLIYDENSIIKIINRNHLLIEKLYLLKINKKNMFIINKAKSLNINIIYIKNITNKKISYIKKYNSIICKTKTNLTKKFDLENEIIKNKECKILILDRIQDPYNFAACLRTAEAFSFNIILTNEKNCAKNTSLIGKISNCSNFFLKIIHQTNIEDAINILIKHNFEIIGLSSKSKKFIQNEKLTTPIAIIIGSEKNGIKKSLKKLCTNMYKIKMFELCKNINVSVATGIFLSKI